MNHAMVRSIAGIAFLLLVAMLVGCSPALAATDEPTFTPAPTDTPSPTDTPAPTLTTSPTPGMEEGLTKFKDNRDMPFYGTVHGHGSTAIILANMGHGGERQWTPLVDALDKDQFTIVTFNWTQTEVDAIIEQTAVVLNQVRASGINRFVCIGASLGVPACQSLTDEPGMVGLVLIAGLIDRDLPDAAYPKLFIVGESDTQDRVASIEHAYERAADPKTLITYPTRAHGTDIFGTEHRDALITTLVDFVNSLVE